MMDYGTCGLVRLLGLVGLGFSICLWAVAARSSSRKMLVSASAGAALIFALVYFIGVMAAGDSEASRFLPRFP